MEEAKRLLVAGKLRTQEIALAVGLGTPDTLRHHFRKRVGISPREYQARFSSGAPEIAPTVSEAPPAVPPVPQPSRECRIAGFG